MPRFFVVPDKALTHRGIKDGARQGHQPVKMPSAICHLNRFVWTDFAVTVPVIPAALSLLAAYAGWRALKDWYDSVPEVSSDTDDSDSAKSDGDSEGDADSDAEPDADADPDAEPDTDFDDLVDKWRQNEYPYGCRRPGSEGWDGAFVSAKGAWKMGLASSVFAGGIDHGAREKYDELIAQGWIPMSVEDVQGLSSTPQKIDGVVPPRSA